MLGRQTKLEEKILNARRRVWVVSPYLSRETCSMLLELALRGVDVRLVTSPEGIKACPRLHPEAAKIKLLGALAHVIPLVLVALDILTPLEGALVIMALLALIAIRYWNTRYGVVPGIKYEVVRGLHAKAFIIDDEAYVGSANFTVSGLRRNIEYMTSVDTRELEEQLRAVFKVFH